jgi:RIO kinase 1
MVDPLAPLLADGIVDEVVGRLKSGKEADLWVVRHAGEVVAAKVYKARQARSFRNRAVYKEGRRVRDTRTQRALDRGSRFGRAAEEEAWKAKEADALHALHAAGVRVPRPLMFYQGVLLMELVVDEAGRPAPRLVEARVPAERAAALYADLRGQAIRMLGCDLIHGDLSPYNVLLGRGGPVVIDFPQVIGAAHNSQAEGFFRRDLENLRRFFAALDPALHRAAGDAGEIWRAYVRRELTGDFVPTGQGAEPRHRPARGDARHAQGRGEPRQHPPGGAPRPPSRPAAPPPPDRGRRHRDRPRSHPPAPEVVRVSRPPHGPAAPAAHGPAAPAAHGPAAPAAHGPAAPAAHGPAPTAAAPHGPPTAGTRIAGGPGHPGHRRRRRRRR